MRRREARAAAVAEMRRIEIETATRLVTTDESLQGKTPAAFRGQLVRLQPSKDALKDDVDRVARELLSAGALAVKVGTKATQDVVAFTPEPKARMTLGTRALLEVMIEESSSSRKDKLSDLIDELAGKAGI